MKETHWEFETERKFRSKCNELLQTLNTVSSRPKRCLLDALNIMLLWNYSKSHHDITKLTVKFPLCNCQHISEHQGGYLFYCNLTQPKCLQAILNKENNCDLQLTHRDTLLWNSASALFYIEFRRGVKYQ